MRLVQAWRRSLPLRWQGLVVPYLRALGVTTAGYAAATALAQPWQLGHWWSIWVPVGLGFGLCWWLWRPWSLLARNYKGESRRAPLLISWVLLVLVCANLRDYLYQRLGEVRQVYRLSELTHPGTAVFFRLHTAYYLDKPATGHYASLTTRKLKHGQEYYSTCYYACPLRAAASSAAPVAWLTYQVSTLLGNDLPPGEQQWRYANFVARTNARFDSLSLPPFAYLARPDDPDPNYYRAVAASSMHQLTGGALLLTPVAGSWAARGAHQLHLALAFALGGACFVSLLLLLMPLSSASYA